MFRLFGVGLHTLFVTNAVVAGVAAILLGRLVGRIAGRWAALGAVGLFGSVFVFGHHTGVGNYNWIAPYAHELTHGTVFGLLSLDALSRRLEGRSRAWTVLAGLCLGATWLTKPEVALATSAAVIVLLGLGARIAARRAVVTDAKCVLAGVCVPLVAVWLVLLQSMGVAEALDVLSAPYRFALDAEVAALPFYRRGMGLDAPGERLLEIALWTAAIAGFCALLAGVSVWRARLRDAWRPAPSLLVLGLLALVSVWLPDSAWTRIARPFPLLSAGVLVAFGRRAWLARPSARRDALTAAFALFALLLGAKMGLAARLHHYGFVLALPGTALLCALVLGFIPDRIAHRGLDPVWPRAIGFTAALLVIFALARVDDRFLATKTEMVGQDADTFRADGRAALLRPISNRLAGSVLVLPEGVMLNYLARTPTPGPCVNFMPPEVLLFGEQALVDGLRRRPPEQVLLVHKDTSEYGLPRFGTDYGALLMGAVTERFHEVLAAGDPPFEPGSRFGARLLAAPRDPPLHSR